MPIVYIIIGIAFIGFVLYLINNHVNMDPKFKSAINWIAIIFLVFWFLRETGIWTMLLSIRV